MRRNIGARLATGRWLYFLDSDDEISADGFLTLIQRANGVPEVIVGGEVSSFFEDRGMRTNGPNLYAIGDFVDGDKIPPSEIMVAVASCAHFLYPRSAFDSVGGFHNDIVFGEDYDFNARLAIQGKQFYFFDGVVCRKRIHNGPRLSRGVAREKYARLLVSIRKNWENAHFAFQEKELAVIKHANWVFSLGRSCYRAGYPDIGDEFIDFSERIGGVRARTGSPFAKAMYRIFSPRAYEKMALHIKSAIGRSE